MEDRLPLTQDLVFVGGGHTHALTLRMWGMRPLPGVRVTLIDPNPVAAYSGMLPGHVAGHYRLSDLEIDLVRLARHGGARLITDRAVAIDRAARTVTLAGGRRIRYDLLSLDIGITSAMPAIPGFAEHAVPAKPLAAFADRWRELVESLDPMQPAVRITVVGGGVAGAELAMAMAHRIHAETGRRADLTVIDRGAALKELAPASRGDIRRAMASLGITLRENTALAAVESGATVLDSGERLTADLVVGVAGAAPHAWLADTGLELESGFVVVDRQLRSVGDPRIYATGDCAHLGWSPRPKAGVYAVRQAPILCRNLRADLSGGMRRDYRPQRDYLKLVSMGGRSARAEKFGLGLSGPALWRLKDRIDRKFMARFADLSPMRLKQPRGPVAKGVRQLLADDQPRCGGCGAKVGAAGLLDVLSRLPAPDRADVLTGAGDDAAVLRCGDGYQVISTDHLRAFTPDPWAMGRAAALHALGDVWAMGAEPQSALATVILPRMAERMQADALAEIMAAAADVFTAAGASIVGGHTTEGAEMTVGFTVTGLRQSPPIGLAGARPGDAILLTKPLGTGTLLAAEMTLKAQGRWIAALGDGMFRPQGDAAAILTDAHAMTDITGFGLAGHLAAILAASGAGAEIDWAAVPLFEGAAELARGGIRSTLHPANRAATPAEVLTRDSAVELAFDPQTCGGLLACVEAHAAPALLDRLLAAGYPAAMIGRITGEAGRLVLR